MHESRGSNLREVSPVTWIRSDHSLWLVTSRPDAYPVVAGVTFAVGWLHQPTEHLGVLALLAAWIGTSLRRPTELTGMVTTDTPQISFQVDQTHSSLLVVAEAPELVAQSLVRVDAALDDLPTTAEFDSVRDRAKGYANALTPWRMHLVTRWPGHRPHLAALGSRALATLGPEALEHFVGARFRPAPRVYWANDSRVAELVQSSAGARHGAEPREGRTALSADGSDVAPGTGRSEPGCVVRRSVNELATVAVHSTPVDDLGCALLGRALHRRLVEFEPLTSTFEMMRYDLGGGIALACAIGDIVAGKSAEVSVAMRQTLEDLASGELSAGEIGRVRDVLADQAAALPPETPNTMLDLVQRHLRSTPFATPETVAAALASVTEDAAREVLRTYLSRALLAVDADAENPPFPMAESSSGRVFPGRSFVNWAAPGWAVRCSEEGLSLLTKVQPRHGVGVAKWVPRSGISFDEVVLRLDAGTQRTTLIDAHLRSIDLAWDSYRKTDRLRQIVDQQTREVPVIREPEDPQWSDWLARRRRARRRDLTILICMCSAVVPAIILAAVLERADGPLVTTIGLQETATLPNGARLRVASAPELIEHYRPHIGFVYAVQVEMCGGREYQHEPGEPRNLFSHAKFNLDTGQRAPYGYVWIAERPAPTERYLDKDQCASGWLTYQLPDRQTAVSPRLEYTNLQGDEVTWQLPAKPRKSPLSKPCPPPSDDPGTIIWVGCQ